MSRKKPVRKTSEAALAKLTGKQRKFIEGKVEGKTDRQAALEAGYAPSTADNTKGRIMGTPTVQEAFQQLLRETISEDLIRRLHEGLNATETKFFQKDGIITDSRDVVAWSERRQYAELAIRCGYIPERGDMHINASGGSLVIQFQGPPPPWFPTGEGQPNE